MSVSELIAILQAMPQDLPVVVLSEASGGLWEPDSARVAEARELSPEAWPGHERLPEQFVGLWVER